ncbi:MULTISPECIES: hypothetical protein [Protofrankia]|uniref:hypothetical protein n=1 Tax=Protofrankia TaxID=2994361 RepID=UPI00031A5B7E|nr:MULTISPECIES: hypothetical protein [Protofrankia]
MSTGAGAAPVPGAQERFAVAVADYLAAVADHWAVVTTLAGRRGGDAAVTAYAAAVDVEARVRVAQAQARVAGAPRDELADVFDLVAAVTLDRVAAWYLAGRPYRPAGLGAAERALARAARPVAARRTARRGGGPGRPVSVGAVA